MDYSKKIKTLHTANLLDTKITVILVEHAYYDDKFVFGLCKYNDDCTTIYISDKNEDGTKISEESKALTLRHELFHCILDMLCYNELSYNEQLVEWLAKATNSLHKQNINI